MFRSKIKFALLTLGILGSLAFGLFVDYHLPGNPVSVVFFKLVYTITPFKYSFLEYYSPLRRGVNNLEIPDDVNSFLCEKLEFSEDAGEIEAIVHFYGIQAGGRESGAILQRSEKTQEKIIGEIMRQLESGEGTYLAKKIVLLDEVRIGAMPGKGHLGIENMPLYPGTEPAEGWVKWSDTNKAPLALPYLRTWWNSGLSWEEKKKIDPFAGTRVRIGYCC